MSNSTMRTHLFDATSATHDANLHTGSRKEANCAP